MILLVLYPSHFKYNNCPKKIYYVVLNFKNKKV